MIKKTPRLRHVIGILSACFLSMSADIALGQVGGKDILEQRLHSKLERILNPDEYLLDIRLKSDASGATAPVDSFLPGLQVLGPVYDGEDNVGRTIVLGGNADLLLILDKKVSNERAQVARDIVSRTIDAEGLKDTVKVSSQQRDIKKTPEPPPAPPLPPREPSFLEQLVQEKDFLSRALLVFWGGLVSLMAIYFLLRRFLLAPDRPDSDNRPAPMGSGGLPPVTTGAENQSAASKRSEKTREELYSKDEALLAAIKEITEESRSQPQKAARILSRWVSQSTELSRAAALYLRNCDIKTVELICQAMHPSDLEKIIANKIEDFEPFGTENQRVIERMRADLAVLASEVVLRERPDPLNFLRRLSNEEIRNLLDGETEETVALVASQLPAHRLQKFYDSVPPEAVKAIVSKLSSLKSASARDFESLQALLNNKIQILANNLVNEKDLLSSIQATIKSLASPTLQCELAENLRIENAGVYEKVRPTILLPTDLRFLPGRVKSLLVQSVDADALGVALSGLKVSFDLLLEGLPPAYQSVFVDAQSRRSETNVVNESWRRVSAVLEEMLVAGLISKNEITFTIRRAEEQTQKDLESQSQRDDQKDGFGRGAA
ncbi:MAG: hypothetical protein WCL28_10530 [bacterium]